MTMSHWSASRALVAGAAVVLSFATSPRASAEEIRALSGTFTDEPVRSIQKEGTQLVLKTDKRTIPLEHVKSIRFDERPVPEGGDTKVILLSRDWLRGKL